MPSISLTNLRQQVIRRLYEDRFPVVSTTTSLGSTTALNDTVLSPNSQLEDFKGAWVLIAELVASGPAVGEVAQVTNVDFTGSASQLIVSPAFTAAVQNGTDYELHYEFHPRHVREAINRVLDSLRRDIYLPLTLVTDGDMEATGTTDWTASNATLAKDTTTVLHGRRSLSVTATAASGQARSANVNVKPGEELLVAAFVFITGGDQGRLVLWNVTNGAEIDRAQTDITGWALLFFKVNAPATCEQVQLRLEAVNNTDVVYFNSAILLQTRTSIYDYPSTLDWSEELDRVFYFPIGEEISTTFSDNAHGVFENRFQHWSHFSVLKDETAVTPYRASLHKRPSKAPLFILGRQPYAELSAETDTTVAPDDIVRDMTVAELLETLARRNLRLGQLDRHDQLMIQASVVRAQLQPRLRQIYQPRGMVQGSFRDPGK